MESGKRALWVVSSHRQVYDDAIHSSVCVVFASSTTEGDPDPNTIPFSACPCWVSYVGVFISCPCGVDIPGVGCFYCSAYKRFLGRNQQHVCSAPSLSFVESQSSALIVVF